ncbi:MAG: hypothetical protein CMM84_04640 [Rhodothermaceae bacterium]|nr:hypothetical protein [Rhodothermaceae bacterium]
MHLSRLFPLALVALVAAAPAAQPDLRISSFLEEGDQQAEAGDRVTVEYTVTNSGDQDVEDVPVAFYFSNDAAFDDGDQFLEAEEVNVEAGESEGDSEQFNLPSGIADGDYFVLAVVDPNDFVFETDETNNVGANAITIGEGGGGPGPDLVVSASVAPDDGDVGTSRPDAGEDVTLDYTVSNVGGVNSGSLTLRFYFSSDTAIDGADEVLLDIGNDGVDAGDNADDSATVTIPEGTVDGTYYILLEADTFDEVAETNEGNNTASVEVGVPGGGGGGGGGGGSAADLVVSGTLTSGDPMAGEDVTLDYAISNVGDENTGPLVLRFYFSADPVLDPADDVLLDIDNDGVDADDESDDSATVTIPEGTADGTYYIVLEVDADEQVAESDEDNNTAAVEVTVDGTSGGNAAIGEIGVFNWPEQEPGRFYPIFLERAYTSPVVVAPSFSSEQVASPAVPRVRDVTADRFEIQLAEWPYLNGTHLDLDIPYLVVEEGVHTLDDGRRIEAGFTTTNGNGVGSVDYATAFPAAPIVFAQAIDTDAVVTARLRVREDRAQVRLVQQEAGGPSLAPATVAWVAIEAGVGSGSRPAVAKRVRAGDSITRTRYGTTVSTSALILAATQSIAEADPVTVRVRLTGRIGARLLLQEERSADDETSHAQELVGYAVFEPGTLRSSSSARVAPVRASSEASALVMGARPNPVRGRAVVAFEVAEAGTVRLDVFDTTGRRVTTLADGPQTAGTHEVPLDASRWSAGVYLVRLVDGAGAVTTSQLTVLR